MVDCAPALWLRGVGDRLEITAGPDGDRGFLARVAALDPASGLAWDRLVAIGRGLEGAGGLAGFFSYDLGRRFERLPELLPVELPWDFVVGLYDGGRPDPSPPQPSEVLLAGVDAPPTPDITADEHRAGVEAIREHIRAGTIYQANLTFRLRAPASDPRAPLATWLRLRAENPAPWAAYMDLPGVTLVSASPESFLEVDGTGRVTSRPIKGTTARHADAQADAASRSALLRSGKDRAELSMIVDLVRNDLGRVCVPGSVDRNPALALEQHPTVWHLVGEVTGQLAEDRDAWDLLRAAFPPGSCIGAPKIRSMAVLESLETTRRGPYTGAMGWIGFDGRASLSVAIRTIVFSGGEASFGVGGGIVFDSVAEAEWDEALLKGRALERALRAPPRVSAGTGAPAFP